MIRYVKHFDSNKIMSFKVIVNNKLLKRYSKIWERVSSLMNRKFDSKPVYGDSDKYISSVKWSVLAHLKSQPRGQNFQTQI